MPKKKLIKWAEKLAMKDKNKAKVYIEALSCGHANNMKISGRKTGKCPKGDLNVTVDRVELYTFDLYQT